MKLFYSLADIFINTFGITRPSAAARRRAALFILSLMILTLAGVTVAGLTLHEFMR